MRKLYRKGTVHPSPPSISDHLAFLPAAILTLTVALSPEDREVLAYLLSSSNNNFSVNNFHGHRKNNHQKTVSFSKSKSSSGGSNNSNDHPPVFNCDCFRCYLSYWAKWDASPNRQLIHEIIDAFEDELMRTSSNSCSKKIKNTKKDKKKKGSISSDNNNEKSAELKRSELSLGKNELAESSESVKEPTARNSDADSDDDERFCDEGGEEKGTVRKFVSFIGERIWGVWG